MIRSLVNTKLVSKGASKNRRPSELLTERCYSSLRKFFRKTPNGGGAETATFVLTQAVIKQKKIKEKIVELQREDIHQGFFL